MLKGTIKFKEDNIIYNLDVRIDERPSYLMLEVENRNEDNNPLFNKGFWLKSKRIFKITRKKIETQIDNINKEDFNKETLLKLASFMNYVFFHEQKNGLRFENGEMYYTKNIDDEIISIRTKPNGGIKTYVEFNGFDMEVSLRIITEDNLPLEDRNLLEPILFDKQGNLGLISETYDLTSLALITGKEIEEVEIQETVNDNISNLFNFTNKNTKRAGFVNLFYNRLIDIVYANPMYDFSYLWKRNYYIVTEEDFLPTIEYLKTFRELAVDTETTGLDINFREDSDELVGIVISGKVGESFYFPVGHDTPFKIESREWYNGKKPANYDLLTAEPVSVINLRGGNTQEVVDELKDLLETKDIILFNASFDYKVMYKYGVNLNVVADVFSDLTLTLSSKEYNGEFFSLKDWTLKLLNRMPIELDMVSKNKRWTNDSGFNFKDLPYEIVRFYAGADTDNTLELYLYMKGRNPQNRNIMEEYNAQNNSKIMAHFLKVVGYHEFYGHKYNEKLIPQLSAKIQEDKERYFNEMKEELKKYNYVKDFNPQSSQQIAQILYEVMEIPKQYNRNTGNVTADGSTLEKLNAKEDENGNKLYPFVDLLINFKETQALEKALIKNSSKFMTEDGFVFPQVDPFLATGRISVKTPNYQSYDDDTKRYIEARDGYYMVDFDYSAIELRIMHSLANDKPIIEKFKDPSFDIHREQASRLRNIPYVDVTPQMRQDAKALNFGIPYGLSVESLASNLYGVINETTKSMAQELMDAYERGNKDVIRLLSTARYNAYHKGYTETYLGHRRYYNKNSGLSKGGIERRGGNHIIQGTAADFYKTALIRLHNELAKRDLLGKILVVAMVHDEAVLEVHNSIHPIKALEIIRGAVEFEVDGFAPMFIGLGYGNNWYEAKSEFELPVELQKNLVKGGPEAYPNWDGDLNKFMKWLDTKMVEFHRNKVLDYITDFSNDGEELPKELLSEILEYFGQIKEKIPKTVKTDNEFIKYFADNVGLEKNQYITVKEDDIEEVNTKEDLSVSSQIKMYEEEKREKQFKNIQNNLDVFGNFLSVENKYIILDYNKYPQNYIQNYFETVETDRNLRLIYLTENGLFRTDYFISTVNANKIVDTIL